MSILKFCGIVYAVLCLHALSPAQTIIYVDASASGAADGTSWKDAYVYFKDATDQLNRDPSTAYEVRVAKGTYYPTGFQNSTDRDVSFFIVQHDALRRILGGYPAGGGQRDPAAHKTVLSGDIGVQGDSTDNSRQILLLGSPRATADSLILDGFTISGGYLNYIPEGEDYIYTNALNDEIRIGLNQRASAVWLSAANGGKTQIRNCTMEKNTSELISIFTVGRSRLSILNCIFSGNYGGSGGALNVTNGELRVEKSEFRNNIARNTGGAIFTDNSSVYLSESTVSGNFSHSFGGAIRIDNCEQLFVDGCIISNNGATGFGGAIYLNNVLNADFENTLFAGNKAASFNANISVAFRGGAIFSSFFRSEGADDSWLNFLKCTFSYLSKIKPERA